MAGLGWLGHCEDYVLAVRLESDVNGQNKMKKLSGETLSLVIECRHLLIYFTPSRGQDLLISRALGATRRVHLSRVSHLQRTSNLIMFPVLKFRPITVNHLL